MRQPFLVMVAVIGFVSAQGAFGQDPIKTAPGVETEIKKTYDDNLKASQDEDLEATLKTIHSKSPVFGSTKQALSQIYGKGLNAKYKLLSFKYLTTDGDYAIARLRQQTTRTPAENFKNNEVEMIMIFRKEDGTWKVWTQAILEIDLIND